MNPIIPDWPAPACVRAFSTLRSGGLSMAPYHGREKKDGGLNLGLHVGDDARIVLENRARLRRFLPPNRSGSIRCMATVSSMLPLPVMYRMRMPRLHAARVWCVSL